MISDGYQTSETYFVSRLSLFFFTNERKSCERDRMEDKELLKYKKDNSKN